MRKFCLFICTLLLILLAACAGNSAPPQASEPAPASAPQPAAQPVLEVPAVQEGLAYPQFMEEGAQKVSDDPAAFGEFFASYLEENAAFMFIPDEYSPFNVGRLLDVSTAEKPQPAGQNKVLVTYNHLENKQAGFIGESGIFLDCLALLPIEQIPDSLLVYDKLIKIVVEPVIAFKYGNGLPAIRWDIGVTCLDMASGEIASAFFSGGAPPDMAWAQEGARYIDGPFPLDEAVAYALELAAALPGQPLPEPTAATAPMRVYSDGEINGVLDDEYGLRGQQQENGVPTRSLPLKIVDAPPGTVCYALIMLDIDAHGFAHWLAANFTAAELNANASIENAADMVQGINDFGRLGYGGPTPPDKPHTYTITVYALDVELPLATGFTLSELEAALQGHSLSLATLKVTYSP